MQKVLSINLEDVTALILGLGAFCQWWGLLLFLSYFDKFNVSVLCRVDGRRRDEMELGDGWEDESSVRRKWKGEKGSGRVKGEGEGKDGGKGEGVWEQRGRVPLGQMREEGCEGRVERWEEEGKDEAVRGVIGAWEVRVVDVQVKWSGEKWRRMNDIRVIDLCNISIQFSSTFCLSITQSDPPANPSNRLPKCRAISCLCWCPLRCLHVLRMACTGTIPY